MEPHAGVFVSRASTDAWEADPDVPGTEMHELVHADGVWAGLTRYTRADGPVPWTPERREVALILEGSVRIEIAEGGTLELGVGVCSRCRPASRRPGTSRLRSRRCGSSLQTETKDRGMEHPNATTYRRTADAFRAGDREALAALIDEDVVWHIPGSGPLAGDIQGREALFRFFDRLLEVTEGTFMIKEHDILGSDEHVVALSSWSAVREGPRERGCRGRLPLSGRSAARALEPPLGYGRLGSRPRRADEVSTASLGPMRSADLHILTGARLGEDADPRHHRRRYPLVGSRQEVLAEQRAIDGDGTYDRNASLFVDLLLQRSIDKHVAARTESAPVLFDRGVPDYIAYASLWDRPSRSIRPRSGTGTTTRYSCSSPGRRSIRSTTSERCRSPEHVPVPRRARRCVRTGRIRHGRGAPRLDRTPSSLRARFHPPAEPLRSGGVTGRVRRCPPRR